MKVIDNYLGKNNHSILKNTMESNSFFWFYNPTKITFSTDLFNYQFSHIFYTNNSINSDYFKILKDLLEKIKPLSLIRIKANLNPISHNLVESKEHVDQPFKCKIAIDYVNSNNGYTMIDGKKVESVEDRIVFFDSDVKHYGTNSTNCKNRMVINFNYF